MRLRTAALSALVTTAGLVLCAPAALAAGATVRGPGGGTARPAFANPGDASPSLSLSVTPAGQPDAAAVGKGGSLWFYTQRSGHWHRTEVGRAGTADSGPSLFAGAGGVVCVAVEGPSHTLQFYALSGGHWRRTQVAGKNTAYSTPSIAVGPAGPGIAVQGRNHSLWYFSRTSGHWHGQQPLDSGFVTSAPSLVIRSVLQSDAADPAGQVDIAYQGVGRTLGYLNSTSSGHWQNDLIGTINAAYSTPSLIVFSGTRSHCEAYLVVEGPNHSLRAYNDFRGWHGALIQGNGWVFSAPSLTQGDLARQIGVAFRGPSNSVAFFYLSTSSDRFVNDILSLPANGHSSSAPALFFRTANPASEDDLIFQGSGNTLWYYHALKPAAANLAPQFTGSKIAGAGSTFGG